MIVKYELTSCSDCSMVIKSADVWRCDLAGHRELKSEAIPDWCPLKAESDEVTRLEEARIALAEREEKEKRREAALKKLQEMDEDLHTTVMACTMIPTTFVLDVDGVLTPGNFFYDSRGKVMKEFGADDFDLLRALSAHMNLHFITADKKGFDILSKRIHDEYRWPLSLVTSDPIERWEWILDNLTPVDQLIFMGDGCKDFICLREADLSITTNDALDHVKNSADWITKRAGGNRAVAEAAILILKRFNLHSFLDETELDFEPQDT